MLRGYRSIIATVAGLAVLATLLFFLIRDLSSVDSAYSHTAADASVEYQGDASAYIEKRCFSPTGLREEDCAAKAREAAREGQRKEQDLAAQNITAWWTKVMGIAALIGMALSAVGVWLVKTTFNETRKANDIAAKHQRAWVQVHLKVIDHESADHHSVAVEVENIGASVATNVTAEYGVYAEIPASPLGGEHKTYTYTIKAGDLQIVSATEPTFGIFDDAYFAGVVSYDTVLGGPHYTYFCIKLIVAPDRPWITGPSRAGIPEVPNSWPKST